MRLPTAVGPPTRVPLARLPALLAVALVVLGGLAQARPAGQPDLAGLAACHSRLTVIAHAQGSPDDLVWDGKRLLVSDINQGTVGVVAHGHVRTLAGHIGEPEGIVPGPANSIIVAAQKNNRVLEIKLPSGARKALAKLPLSPGQEGIDGINADGPGAVWVPDSAHGRLYVLHLATRKLTLFARGLNRPVAAIRWHGAVYVADEYASAVWRIGPAHRRTELAHILLPDDLAVIFGHLMVNSLLGDIWEASPHLRMLSSAFAPATSDPQGMVGDGPDAVIIADQSRNAIYRLSRLSGCL